MTEPKILIYDIESSNLSADWGTMLCLGYEWYGTNKPKVISLLDTNTKCKGCKRIDTLSDAPLLEKVREILCEADLIVSWYGREGRGFDSRFINARLLHARLAPLPLIPQVDLHVTMRDRFKLGSNRLQNVQRFLQLSEEKTPLDMDQWQLARAGDIQGLKYVNEHCLADVRVLREAYTILRPWVLTHPRVKGWGTTDTPLCPVCGAAAMLRRKRRMTRTKGIMIQYQCQECGGYDSRAEGVKK